MIALGAGFAAGRFSGGTRGAGENERLIRIETSLLQMQRVLQLQARLAVLNPSVSTNVVPDVRKAPQRPSVHASPAAADVEEEGTSNGDAVSKLSERQLAAEASAHELVLTARQNKRWTSDDRALLHQSFADMTLEQQNSVLSELFPAINRGEIIPDGVPF